MSNQEIRKAGEAARILAQHLASQVRASNVPTPHWHEVIERLREYLLVGVQ